MIRFLDSPMLSILIRLGLGAIFVYAAWPKIYDPPNFAHLIWNYKIMPSELINPMAIVLPWLEMACGVALISGMARRGAALLTILMLVVFISALATDIVRDIPVNCGCFSVTPVEQSHAQMIAEMKMDVVRDLGMLAMAFHSFFSRVTWQALNRTPEK